jgi:uncharacterized protein
MKIIITGGTGLIGNALAENLARDGREVIVLSRGSEPGNSLATNIRYVKWDGRSVQGWGHLVDGAGAIVNLAGKNLSSGRWTDRNKQEVLDSRLNAGAALVQAVRQAERKPAVLVQSSAVGYYGFSESAVFTEEASPAGDFLGTVGQKWEASTQAVEELGVRRVMVRSGVVLSARSGALPRMQLPFKLFVGGPLGSGRQWMSWVHLDDEVRALRFLVENPQAFGAFNTSAQPVTNRQFSRSLGKAMRRPSSIPMPAFALRLLFGEMSSVLLQGQRVSSQKLLDHGFQFNFPDIDSAFRDLLSRK